MKNVSKRIEKLNLKTLTYLFECSYTDTDDDLVQEGLDKSEWIIC